MIKHDLKIGEELWIGDTRITLKRKSGQVAALLIDAPASVKVITPKSKNHREDGSTPEQTV